MVIADVNILCVEQAKEIEMQIPGVSTEIFYNISRILIYGDRYQEIQAIPGIWYRLTPLEREQGKYQSEFFDLAVENGEYRVLFLRKNLKDYIITLTKNLVLSSPWNCLHFFIDLQGYKTQKVCVSIDLFCEMVRSEKICFNTVYQIYK